jgi:hypothetical protein
VDYLVKTYSPDTGSQTKKLVEGACGSCHSMDVVSAKKEEWTGVVRDMISYGAPLKESDISEVADYLAKNYGPKK